MNEMPTQARAVRALPPAGASVSQAAPAAPGTAAALDRMLHQWQSHATGGRSPSTVPLAMLDWLAHAANAPFQTAETWRSASTQWQRLARAAMGGPAAIAPPPGDRRFEAPAWQQPPFNLLTQAVLLAEEYWSRLVASTPGVARPNQRIVSFTVRQFLDMISPSNIPWLNPEVIAATRDSGGANLTRGMKNFLRDQGPEGGAASARAGFTVGGNVACTPGEVVFRNDLMELIQYASSTQTAAPPAVTTPASSANPAIRAGISASIPVRRAGPCAGRSSGGRIPRRRTAPGGSHGANGSIEVPASAALRRRWALRPSATHRAAM